MAPALAAGNTLVLKPSPYTPLSTLMAVDAMAELLPAGVLNVVSSDDKLANIGAAMAAAPVAAPATIDRGLRSTSP